MENITLPLWLFIIIIIFAGVMVLDRILLPSVRWVLKRRVNRVIKEINTRLDIKIRPIQLTKRKSLIDQLVFDEKVISGIRQYAKEYEMPFEVAQEKARHYASEIIPAFNAYMYFNFGYWLAQKLARLVYRVHVGFYDKKKIKQSDKEASVVFVMNHRSNMDYILIAFLVAKKTTLSYAVGEWAKIWPLKTIMKSMGMFFVRRKSNNLLYRKVLERYIHISTRAGVCQAVFPEGGLSKNGILQEARYGFVDYMLRDYHPQSDRDVVFVPVGINYDRVIEDRSLLRKLDKTAEKRSNGYILKTATRFIIKNILLGRKKRWRRFGYARVNFGEPISSKKYCEKNKIDFSLLGDDERHQQVEIFTKKLMSGIAQVIPVLSVSLICEAMLHYKEEYKSEAEIIQKCLQRIKVLQENNKQVDMSASNVESKLSTALLTLLRRGIIEEKNQRFKMVKNETLLLQYYANAIKIKKAEIK